MKHLLLALALLSNAAYAQNDLYQTTFNDFSQALQGKQTMSFKAAVFATENAYFEGNLDKNEFDETIGFLTALCVSYRKANTQPTYTKSDKATIETLGAIFKVVTDTTTIIIPEKQTIYHYPFQYDFEDIFGSKNWSNMLVTKLLATHKGNCHSMPYLYKIICENLHVPCHLALAPNHIYIKHRAERGGMYNTELTSAAFPIDAWLMASGYISLEAVQSGIYLDTLSEKQTLALCVLDLAQGYNHKYTENDGDFIIKCCDLTLKYYPNCVNAMLLKAETLLAQIQKIQTQKNLKTIQEAGKTTEAKAKYKEMNTLYGTILKLGYRNMPEQMYIDWLVSLKTERSKYTK
jgi:hypothetical protein